MQIAFFYFKIKTHRKSYNLLLQKMNTDNMQKMFSFFNLSNSNKFYYDTVAINWIALSRNGAFEVHSQTDALAHYSLCEHAGCFHKLRVS